MRVKKNKNTKSVILTLGRAETRCYEDAGREGDEFRRVLRALVDGWLSVAPRVEVYACASATGYFVGQWEKGYDA